jgi:hypothetical protein
LTDLAEPSPASTSCFLGASVKEGVDARHKAGHDN